MRAIILAGGKGSRLKPYTKLIPKALVPIGEHYSILEIVIKQLSKFGFKHITIATNHLSKLIQNYFEDGKKYNIKIDYSKEEKELGTIGPLKLIKNLPENFLVMNSDILTNINYKKILHEHIKKKHLITVGCIKRKEKLNFGIIKHDQNLIKNYLEKPTQSLTVSAGIYCLNKKVLSNIPINRKLDFDKFIKLKLSDKIPVNIYDHKSFWLDIGRVEDYEYANNNLIKISKKIKIKI